MLWDSLLYIPTVIALFSIGLKLWFSPNQSWAYVLFFMASFFFLIGANRILSSRLMMLPSSPISLEAGKQQITLTLRSGNSVNLMKEVRFFPDYAGKSFGLSGIDVSGKRQQFVFHRGQFAHESEYTALCATLNVYK